MHHAHATFASTSCDQASPSTSLPRRQPHLFSLLTGISFHHLHQFPYSHLSSKFYKVFVSKAINSLTSSLARTLDLRFRRYRRLQCGTAGNGFWRLILLASFSFSHRVHPRTPHPPFPLPYSFRASRQTPGSFPGCDSKALSHLKLHFLPSHIGTPSVPPFLHSLSNLLQSTSLPFRSPAPAPSVGNSGVHKTIIKKKNAEFILDTFRFHL